MGKNSSSGPRRADEPWRHVPVRLCVSRAPGGHDQPVCLAQGERSLWLRQGWTLELGFQQQGNGQNPPPGKEGAMECPRSLATEGLFCPVVSSEVANLQLVVRMNGIKRLRIMGGNP